MWRNVEQRILKSTLNFPLGVEVQALSPSWKYPKVGHIEKKDTGIYFHYKERNRHTFQYMDGSWRVWKDNVEVEPYKHEHGIVVSIGKSWTV